MSSKNRKRFLSMIACLLIFIFATVCTGCARGPEQRPVPQKAAPKVTDNHTSYSKSGPNGTIQKNRASDLAYRRMLTGLEGAVRNVPGIQKATVLVNKDTALVGLRLKSDVKTTDISKIKKDAENALRKAKPSLKDIHVTTDSTLVKRLEEVRGGISAGTPFSRYSKEFSDILAQVPTVR